MGEQRRNPSESSAAATESLRLHPQAALIPEMGKRPRAAFVADVAERGVVVPLDVTASGVLLDGRQRLLAALELGLAAVPVRRVGPVDELDYILRAALARRDLTPSQRAVLVVQFDAVRDQAEAGEKRRRANLRQNVAEVATLPPRRGKTRETVAALAGVSARTAQDALTLQRHDPQLLERVTAGQLHVSTAAQRVRRKLRDDELGEPAPLPEGPFELIYADPPWQLGSPDSRHAPEQHYPTMPLPEIEALTIPAASDAVLFLWAVNSLLPEALDVIKAWGFTYKAHQVWSKPSIKLGNWFRNRHELLLFGRKGNYPPPARDRRVASLFEAPCGRHSEKPACVYELIEHSYPTASKLELFRRGKPQPGWGAWGNVVEA